MTLPAGTRLLHPGSLHLSDDASGGPLLIGSRCAGCSLVVFPALAVCPRCAEMGRQMIEARIGRTGRLYSHSIAYVAPQGFTAPYFQAFVELPEGPRIFTLIGSECPVERGVLEDGIEMRPIVERVADTPERRDQLTYKYVPANRTSGGRR